MLQKMRNSLLFSPEIYFLKLICENTAGQFFLLISRAFYGLLRYCEPYYIF